MNIFKIIFGQKVSRVWFIVSAALIVLLSVITVLCNTLLYSTVVSVLGGSRAVFAEGSEPIYETDITTKAQALEAANDYNETICEEGFILLKNENGALPIYTPVSTSNRTSERPKVSVFGKNSVNLAIGGSGSGARNGGEIKTIYDSLAEAGYDTNGSLKDFYEGSASGRERPAAPEGSNLNDGKTVTIPTYETPVDNYPASVWNTFKEYNDAAIIVITRMGGEGFDLPRTMEGVTGARTADDHYLQMDQNEADLITDVCNAGFKRVVLVLNVGTAMEIGFVNPATERVYNSLKDYHIDSAKIDACVWMGFPGSSGAMALGRILNGNVNPSGRTTDTYAVDFKQDPTWANFGDNLKVDGDRYTDSDKDYFFVDYEEGIYVGYRYYETRGEEDEKWYADNVVYPFGYGLSYTNFVWTLEDAAEIADKQIDGRTAYTVKVRVKNDGAVAGKEVVQLYGKAPYEYFGIEKPSKVLLDFKKTALLQPGEEEVVELTFVPYYLASFDYNNVNANGFAGYELEASDDYSLVIGKNAHSEDFTVDFGVSATIKYENDPVTGEPVAARYTGNENGYFDADLQLSSVLLRGDWEDTWPAAREAGEMKAEVEFVNALKDTAHNNPTDFSALDLPSSGIPTALRYRDMMTKDGVYGFAEGTADGDKWQPFVSYDDGRWAELLNACQLADLVAMYDYGAFKSDELAAIGKPLTNDTDGPAGFVNFMLNDGTYYDTCYYAAQIVVASTWSSEIAEGFGKSVGTEGIVGAAGRGNGMPYSGWYAPGMNIHRSPFGGRNFEYMSEDSMLTGKMAAAQIRGCQSKGVYCFMKHFAVNDQETHRSSNGLSVWLTEQAMREIYLRPFEIAVKEGGARAVMSSFNRIGTRWTGGDYRLITEILRNEWGFRGSVISDFTSGSYMNAKQMAYAGGALNLNNQKQYAWNDFDPASVADVTVIRRCAQDVMYTVINSNAMNGEISGYKLPVWQVLLIVADCVIFAGIAVWGSFAIRKALKKTHSHAA